MRLVIADQLTAFFLAHFGGLPHLIKGRKHEGLHSSA